MLSIIVVNWNTRDYLRTCIRSIERAQIAVDNELIVVDNASSDGSAEMLKREFPLVDLIEAGLNLGFAAANNCAFQACRGDVIWLLNPDTEVLPGAAELMYHFLKRDSHRGGVASMLVDAATGQPQRSCRTFPTPAALWCEALGLARSFPRSRRYGFYRMGWWNYRQARRVEQPMAASFMVTRTAVERSGGLFDESYPIFFNDVDLCRRLISSGFEIWYLPGAQIVHHGGVGTRQAKAAMIAESHASLLVYYERNFRNILSPWLYWPTVCLIRAAGRVRFFLARHDDKYQAPSTC